MNLLTSFVVGLVFGLGLIISGMSNPAKVLGFLDLAGNWDPSLAFVMIGAISLGFFAFKLIARRNTSLLGGALYMPTAKKIDHPLILGSLLFGIGWGLAGICPGPALVLLGAGSAKGIVFALAMLAGMAIFEWRS